MDLACYRTLNAMLGNSPSAAAIEWALTGGALLFSQRTTFAIGGATVTARLNDRLLDPYRAYQATEGDTLVLDVITSGRFLYIAFAGGAQVETVMRSSSTYLPGGFGGVGGRRLSSGDSIAIGARSPKQHHVSESLPASLRPERSGEVVRFVAAGEGTESVRGQWSISPASDRTGYRLTGRATKSGESITSTGVCPGTIQVPPAGEPIVLMADAPTVGGYRIAGAVATTDLGKLAQMVPGESVTLEEISVEIAQRLAHQEAERVQLVRDWALG